MKSSTKKPRVDMTDSANAFIESQKRLVNSDGESSDDDDVDTNGAQQSYTDLINDLTQIRPNPAYGHFESYAYALYCHDCQMVLQPKNVTLIPCKVPEVVVQQDGTVIYVHKKCEKMDLTKHIQSIAIESGSWEKTYWRLWAECHFLSCVTCKWEYPVRNSHMCQYHLESPEYAPIGNLGLEQPVGRYPCCGERAFRFELVKKPSGCAFRFHIPNKENHWSRRIVAMISDNPRLTIADPPPSSNRESKIMKYVNLDLGERRPDYQHWWAKMTLGEKDYTLQPIISVESSLTTDFKNTKIWKDSNKRRKKNHIELKKWMSLNYKQTILRSCSNADVNLKTSNEKLTVTKNSSSRGQPWKTSSPLTSLQDLQRERESIFFNRITVNVRKLRKSRNDVKSAPGTTDQLDKK